MAAKTTHQNDFRLVLADQNRYPRLESALRYVSILFEVCGDF
jgi:hypothetical protein